MITTQINLNAEIIQDGCHKEEIEDALSANARRRLPVTSSDGNTEVYFDDLETRLIEHIAKAEVVVGCVAWLTNFRILDALAKRKAVSLVVQKEDFLRPDLQSRPGWSKKLRAAYGELPSFEATYGMGSLIGSLNTNCAQEPVQPVRCVGNYNADKSPAFPRAHHKFLVFADYYPPGKVVEEFPTGDYDEAGKWIPDGGTETGFSDWYDGISSPYAVWTGSFNFTDNATKSFENAVYLTDQRLVNAYFNEYQYLFALSESLDWQHQWVEPEFRIGT